MFTGIVQATGEVAKTDPPSLWVRSSLLDGAAVGASVCVSGTCLTVTESQGDTCRFELAPETVERTTLGALRPGDQVNLERPLRLGDELGGHIVQGHVDGAHPVVAVTDGPDGPRLAVDIGPALGRFVVEKGSLALDGVSLTVARVSGGVAEVALIPLTLAVTTLGRLAPGDLVNVEVDVLAKHVARLAEPWAGPGPDVAGGAGYL